jgi:ectoine hydroxylase-related dioxygenase (phytanoyl-CoA dioxygenase family)
MPVTDEERYLFDLQGHVVVRDAIDGDRLRALNAILDERLADADPEAPVVPLGHGGGEVIGWGKPFLDLVDNPRVLPYLEAFCDTFLRLDHEYVHVIRPGAGSLTGAMSSATLHGGGTPFDVSQFYDFREGRPWGGLTVVAYYLRDVAPGDGGFACVPGSHKANVELPEGFRSLDGELPPFVTPVTAPAGSAVIFTEAQTHGTLPWRGRGERRTAFYKYSPFALSWSWRYYDPDDYPEATERQRALLEPPNGRSPKRLLGEARAG